MKTVYISAKRAIKIIAIIVALILIFYLWADRHTPNTRDAYVDAYVVAINAQVPGHVSHVPVIDNQFVKAGEPLFTLDQTPYKLALKLAQANYEETIQKVNVLQSNVKTAQALVTQRIAELKQKEEKYNEITKLSKKGAVSLLRLQIATKNFSDAKAKLRQANDRLSAAKNALGKIGKLNNLLIAAKATFDLAKWRLGQTIIRAPADGIVTDLKLRSGWYAGIGAAMMSFIESKKWWVVANLKEGNLSRVHPGEKAEISIDMYPGKIFHGKVFKIERGVRLQENIPDAYLPYVPSTTNWVKLAQRFPVRILITDISNQYPLRVGATAHIVIFTPHSAWLGWISKLWLRINNWLGYL